jgi:hypothetical protein
VNIAARRASAGLTGNLGVVSKKVVQSLPRAEVADAGVGSADSNLQ